MVFSGSLTPVGPTTIYEGQSVAVQAKYALTHSGTSSGNTGHFYYNFVRFHSGDGQQIRDYANGRDYSGQQNWSGGAVVVLGPEPHNPEPTPAGWPGNTNSSPGRNQVFDATFTYLDDGSFTLNAHGDSSVGPIFGMNPQAALWYSTGGTPATGIQGPVFNQSLGITVLNVAPTIVSGPLNSIQSPATPFALSALATDPGILDVLTFEWDLTGNGVYDDFVESPGAGGSQTSGTNAMLSLPGVYTLGVRVSDGDGGVATHSFIVTVVPEPTSITLVILGLGCIALIAPRKRNANAGR